jgi:hypothetical protein
MTTKARGEATKENQVADPSADVGVAIEVHLCNRLVTNEPGSGQGADAVERTTLSAAGFWRLN